MAGFITRDECHLVVKVLEVALDALPPNAGALKAKLRVQRNEHIKALKMYDRALADNEGDPGAEIRALGSLEPGEVVQLVRPQSVRRTSETGLCIFDEGRDVWTNYSSKTSPVVVLRNVEVDR